MLLFYSRRLLLSPPTNVGHQTIVGDDAQWCKVFVRITYRLNVTGYIVDMMPSCSDEQFLLSFLKSDLFTLAGIVFSILKLWGLIWVKKKVEFNLIGA